MPEHDTYTLKEVVDDLRLQLRKQNDVHITLTVTLENFNKNLENINKRLDRHEKQLNGFDMFQTRVMAIWAFAIGGMTLFINKLF